MPVPWIQVRSGVSHLAIVSRKPPLSSSSCVHCWTVPLPNVFAPTSVARPRSCSAPATISDADAEPPSTSTTSRIHGSVAAPPGLAVGLDQVAVGVLLPEHRAVGEELARDVAGRRHEPARVAAQVDDQLALAALHGRRDRRVELLGGVVREPGQLDVADGALGEVLGLDLGLDDDRAHDRELERRPAAAQDRAA